MFVIGTAGHVDHGKSLLVQALTGIDPDRLREEKARGMTIDLGFAWLTLPSGKEVSIVDVPGHERFIKNMLAGAGGIDLALLVIAADESVMPQTREHLAILDLLAVAHGVVAITKSDLVDIDMLELVSAEALELIDGTSIAGALIVACSATTGAGLDDLRRVLDEQLDATPSRRDIGRPRLAVDRSFTIAGLGTVVTGTLIDGALEVGQEVEILPGEQRARIRGLQHHKQRIERALPGRRTAVNLSGVAKEDVRRGQVLALPGTVSPATVIDVWLRALSSLRKPLRHDSELTLHTGAVEVPARLLLLDRPELPPGEAAWAQLRLSEPVAAMKGDRFVLRTPNDTVGGGEILDAHARRHKRFHAPTIESLAALVSGAPAETLLAALRRVEPAQLDAVAAGVALARGELSALAEDLQREGRVVALGAALITADGFTALEERARSAVETYLREHPLRRGLPREELRGKLQLDERVFDAALARWRDAEALAERDAIVTLPGYGPRLSPVQQREADAYLGALEANRFAPPTDRPVAPELLAYVEDAGRVVSAGDGVVFAADAYREMVDRITEHLRGDGSITLAQVRDMFGTTRKYAQALLEHLDAKKVTRRVGDKHVLR
jgi:selenocysteine-specific elongation factor